MRTGAKRAWLKRCALVLLFLITVYHLPFTAFADEAWKQAIGPWEWSFPRDHGSHPEYRTEWWYFTGNLTDDAGNRYGYQLTFFRQGLRRTVAPAGAWEISDIYLAHFAVADGTRGKFFHADRASRTGPGLAASREGGMDVHTLNWSARMYGRTILLDASYKGMEIKLSLAPAKPLVLHGERGLSRKGPREGQSSYYYSFTDLRTEGTLKTPAVKSPVRVAGVSWFDQEFGSNQLSGDQVGWDWFGVHLSDGRDLMIYFLRRKDGSVEPTSSGTLVERNGTPRALRLSDIEATVLDRWKSPASGGLYPLKWRIRIPSADIDVTLEALLKDQELTTEASTGVTYWEGVVSGEGTSGGTAITVQGYMELTGYAGSLAGVF